MAQTCALIAHVQPVLHRVSCSNETLPNAHKHYEMHQNMNLWSNGVCSGCVRCEKFWCDFMARTSALIAPVQPVYTEFRVVMKHCQMHPNTTRRTKTWVYGPMGWIGCVSCEKFRCDFMVRTCAWIVPVQPILHRVSCSNKILPNTHKHYETHTNTSLGSNGVDWVRSLRKIPMRLHATNLCINSTISAHFASSFVH